MCPGVHARAATRASSVPFDCICLVCRNLSPFLLADVHAFAALTECCVQTRREWQLVFLAWVLSPSNARRVLSGAGRRHGDSAVLAAAMYAKALDVVVSAKGTASSSLTERLLIAHLFLRARLDSWRPRRIGWERNAYSELDSVLATTGLHKGRLVLQQWSQQGLLTQDRAAGAYDVAVRLLEMSTADALREPDDVGRSWRAARRRAAVRAYMRAIYIEQDEEWHNEETLQHGSWLSSHLFHADDDAAPEGTRGTTADIIERDYERQAFLWGDADPEKIADWLRVATVHPSPFVSRQLFISAVKRMRADVACALLPFAVHLSPPPVASSSTAVAADELTLSSDEAVSASHGRLSSLGRNRKLMDDVIQRAILQDDEAAAAESGGSGDETTPPRVSLTLTPLCIACLNRDEELAVRLLADHGASPNAAFGAPLCWATINGMPRTIKLLLAKGADIGACHGLPLPLAIQASSWDVAAMLFTHACSPTTPQHRGAGAEAARTQALRCAAANGRTDMMRALIHAGARVPAQTHGALRKATKRYLACPRSSSAAENPGSSIVPVNCVPGDKHSQKRAWMTATQLLYRQYGWRERLGAMLRATCGLLLMCSGCLLCASTCCCSCADERMHSLALRAVTAHKYGLQRIRAEDVILSPLLYPVRSPIRAFNPDALSPCDLRVEMALAGCYVPILCPCLCIDIIREPVGNEIFLSAHCGWPWTLLRALQADW